MVSRLEDAWYPLGWEQPPALVAVEANGDLEVRVAPPCDDPLGRLVGLVAPVHWAAVGFLATGRVHDLGVDGTRRYAVRVEPERRARIGHFVDRSGVAVSFLRLGEDRPEVTTGGPRGDRADDVCRRSLGLATAPIAVPIEVFWASWWLARVVEAASCAPAQRWTWPRVARLHVGLAPRVARPTVDDVVAAGVALTGPDAWESLRRVVARGRRLVPDVEPSTARWMDDGMFSRWALESMPPLSHLRDAVSEVVPGEVQASVDAALGAWGLT